MSDSPPLPPLFRERLAAIVPPEHWAICLASFEQPKPPTLRLNPLRGAPAETHAELMAQGFHLTPVPWLPDAYIAPAGQRRALTESAAFYAGRFYLQDLSSMAAAYALAPAPGDVVLDLAAAPGGKTLQLAALMQGQGRLVAVEAIKGRFFHLKANLAQHGAAGVETWLMDGRAAGRRWPAQFDRILLDAPCSSEARFTRLAPQSWAHWSRRKIKECAHKQQGLLHAALHALKPGGVLLYCTCSFAPEENEAVIHHQLRYFGPTVQIEPLPITLPYVQPGLTYWAGQALNPDLSHAVRLLPDATRNGFFMCRLVKTTA